MLWAWFSTKTKASTKVEGNDFQRVLLFSDLFFIEFKMWCDIRELFQRWEMKPWKKFMHAFRWVGINRGKPYEVIRQKIRSFLCALEKRHIEECICWWGDSSVFLLSSWRSFLFWGKRTGQKFFSPLSNGHLSSATLYNVSVLCMPKPKFILKFN